MYRPLCWTVSLVALVPFETGIDAVAGQCARGDLEQLLAGPLSLDPFREFENALGGLVRDFDGLRLQRCNDLPRRDVGIAAEFAAFYECVHLVIANFN